MIYVTKIRTHEQDGDSLFNAVLQELPSLCDSFTCIPSERMFICQSHSNAGHDYTDAFLMRKLNVENIAITLL